MANLIFGADSRLDVDTVSSTSQDSLFPRANLNDNRIFTPLKNSPAVASFVVQTGAGATGIAEVDYFMLVGHDLFDPANDGLGACSFDFGFSNSGSGPFTTLISGPVVATDNRILARTFVAPTITSAFPEFFQLTITRGASFIISLGEVKWGKRVDFPVGAQVGFDPNTERVFARFSRSQSGNILGAVTSYSERRAIISLPLLESTFVDGTAVGDFRDFWDNHASLMKPFLFHWNPGNPGSFEKDAFFAIIDPDSSINRQLTTQLTSGFRTLELEVVGLKE